MMRTCKFNKYRMCNTPCGWQQARPPWWCLTWMRMDVDKRTFIERHYKKIVGREKIGKGRDAK